MAKHTQTIRRQIALNCLSVFGHFVNLALKGLRNEEFLRNFNTLSDYFRSVKMAAFKLWEKSWDKVSVEFRELKLIFVKRLHAFWFWWSKILRVLKSRPGNVKKGVFNPK